MTSCAARHCKTQENNNTAITLPYCEPRRGTARAHVTFSAPAEPTEPGASGWNDVVKVWRNVKIRLISAKQENVCKVELK